MYDNTVRRITKYLTCTSTYTNLPDGNRWLSTHGVVYRPDKEKGIDSYVDANFAGGWYQVCDNNAEIFISCLGYVITYTGCPVLWCSKLQKEITLSTTEAEYIMLRKVMHGVIPFMALMK